MIITKLVLVRHGLSQWNKENRFTGWYDVNLSDDGIKEAKNAGLLLKTHGFIFDFAYTSMLKRAIHTLWNILDILDQSWLPVEKSWKLNERHYGALQGSNKFEMIKIYGEEQIKQWRRGFSTPPSIDKNNNQYSGHDYRYDKLNKKLPLTESLNSTIDRVVSYWKEEIYFRIKNGDKIIIVAHGNSLRALLKYLNNMNEKEFINLNIPTGIPLIYEFNEDLIPIKSYYLN